MLIAKLKNGTNISLVEKWNKRELESILKEQQLLCPVCEGPVQARLGNHRIWHFAHIAGERCDHEYENESSYHLNGKKQLYDWLTRQNINVEVEVYLSEIKQRPDLLVALEHKRYAIEFQCSSIDTRQLSKRTNAYLKENIVPIWILGGNRLKKSSQYIIKPSTFDLLMAYRGDHQEATLIYFCPSTNRFFIATSLVPFTSTTFLANSHYHIPHQLSFQALIHYKNQTSEIPKSIWLSLKKRWRIKTYIYCPDYVKRWFYEKGVPLPLLPGEAGIPINQSYWIKTDLIIWQGWILLECIHPLEMGKKISFRQIYLSFKRMVQIGFFQIRNLPTTENSHYSFEIMRYLQQLVTAGILITTKEKAVFCKRNSLSFPRGIEDACSFDEIVINKLLNHKMGK